MFGTLLGVVGDVARVIVVPIEVAAEVTRAVTKPVADMASTLVHEVKDTLRDIAS